MLERYILDDAENPIICNDIMKWAKWFTRFENRKVAFTITMGVEISTVFIGIDHNFSDSGPPILWETMIFANVGLPSDMQTRYASVEMARLGHELVVAEVERQMTLRYRNKRLSSG